MTRILKGSDYQNMPWKNGLGVTTEIYRVDRDGHLAFRVSSAAVTTSGPFSEFEGYERTLVNLGPGLLHLTHDLDAETTLDVFGVTHFDGKVKTHCRVDRPAQDLNIFCAHDHFFATTLVRELKRPEFVPIPPTSQMLIYVIQGELVDQNMEKREFHVGAGETLLREAVLTPTQERWMLARASDGPCVYAAIVFRELLD